MDDVKTVADPTRPETVQAMFSEIAGRYDLLNHLLSFNQDHRWRRIAAKEAVQDRPARVLDVAGGTGDLSVAVCAAAPDAHVVVSDFTYGMLALAPPKFRDGGASFVTADGLRLPFGDSTFGAVTVGFGYRNFADRPAGLREMMRVLQPGGRLVILEFSQPEGPVFGPLYKTYLRALLPKVGNLLGGGRFKAYGYLAKTVADFPPRSAIGAEISGAGFLDVTATPLTGGIVAVHSGVKP